MKTAGCLLNALKALRPTLKGVHYFVSLLSITVALSGCSTLAYAFGKKRSTFPKVPTCMVGDGGCVCYDPIAQLDFTLTFEQCKNYIVYSPDNWNVINDWMERSCK